MITIHEKTAQTFDTIGLGALVPSHCVVEEELNGAYELELKHPYDEGGKWKRIGIGNIICTQTPNGKQAFRIYKIQPTLDNITVNARHIFYDLLDNYIDSFTTGNGTPQQILNGMKAAFNYTTPFTFQTNLTGISSFSASSCNPVLALLGNGEENDSIISKFGGEIKRDNFNIAIKNSVGMDRGFYIRYSKNLKGLTIDEDASNVITRVFPIGKDGLKGTTVDSSRINEYPFPKVAKVENTECTTKAALDAYVQQLFKDGIDLPTVNIQVDFQMLTKTEEYKNYSVLETVCLGDVVTVVNSKMNFQKKAKVISYIWDCLLEKYEKIELGDFTSSILNAISSSEKTLAVAQGASTEVKQIYNLISQKVDISDNGLYICIDGTNKADATKLFHFGSSGLQYSSNGINGAWNTLIDVNGTISQ